jgi:hypothetical protein
MRLRQNATRIALTSALLIAACADKGSETTTDSATTGQTDTNPDGTTGPDPTTGTTAPDPTTGTTDPEPTTGDPVDPVYEQCKANNADNNAVYDAICQCLVASGDFPDQASCLAEFGNGPEIDECTCMVYGKNPESKATLDCNSGPLGTFADCMATAGCEQDAQDACFSAYYDDAVQVCPDPPPAVQNGIAIECYGEAAFMCGSGEQVPEYYKCDFEPDCMDGSDEVDCPGFMCKNGTLIPLEYECDGSPDCRDMSDEADCPIVMCKSGEEILEKQKCDGVPNCMDESDEVDCPVFMCMDGGEIPESWKCDGVSNCMDESDEVDCPVFMCMDGGEIPESWKCDDIPDCRDGSDEADCP